MAQRGPTEQELALQAQVLRVAETYELDPVEDQEITEFVANLSTYQRNAVDDFIGVTRTNIHIAVRTLRESKWDLIEATARFYLDETDSPDDDDTQESFPEVQPIRGSSRSKVASPARAKKGRFQSASSAGETPWLRIALSKATVKAAKESPRSPRALILDPVTILRNTSPETISVPTHLFDSPYPEKLWYTGFMRP
ncbi:hypothetical protein N0V94_003050 [Neodidymelliopsis sp. IMI 364377]|nr:hypothetical protein N0V94_003050 [Neodidymelliopsis sp. IMI 364377]